MKNRGKQLVGEVVAANSPRTIIVAVSTVHRHPLYKKAVKRTVRFAVHNESLAVAVGDHVVIGETKPKSKTKHFIVLAKEGKV